MPEIITLPDLGLGNSSYLVDLGDGRLFAMDPIRNPAPYLRMAAGHKATIAFSVETHLHADFISGSRELAENGATVVAPADSRLEFPHRRVGAGDDIDLGGLTLRSISTPGHSPEHLSYLLVDGSRPLALFSGGALLPGSVARTDLIAPHQTEPLARSLYRSVRQNLFSLPDDVVVYPTHGTGATFCAVPGETAAATTIGREKTSNPLFAEADEDAFVARLLGSLGTYPPYFARLRDANRRGPRIFGGTPRFEPLTPARVRSLLADGVDVIDVRPIKDFAKGHIPGSLSIELRPAFATWLGWLVPDDRPLVFVIDRNQDRADLMWQCLKVNYDGIAGELAGGISAWSDAGFEFATTPIVAPEDAPHAGGTIVDVRQDHEVAFDQIPEALHVELGALAGADLPDGPVSLVCGAGQRAMTAAAVLERAGRSDVRALLGSAKEVGHALRAKEQTS